MKRGLLLDDEPFVLKALQRVLTPAAAHGQLPQLQLDLFAGPAEALDKARHTAYDFVIADYRMPIMSGVEFLRQLRAIQADTVRIILSGQADLEGIIGAINIGGIHRFIAKPWDNDALIAVLAEELANRETRLENGRMADAVRVERGSLTAEELERRRLEALEPGITQVNWGPDGAVLLDESLLDAPEARHK
ncbi:response regulator [Propionivibrio dicarboxylicus]|uniref:Response regulator receiver domain-containing protein n=1 Tax=Propionivibrio dicarboxylicus TaxID=83767 RepID=A0A1G8DSQ3_9RHOO|nr:response regulator [Propionivibrio dicarboxylicus]SDH60682.1 Response regulator receiver domain-containing protein [Propionivibrio dicarboxylicus]